MVVEKNLSLHIFALAAYGQGISGGDRIFIEFARRWAKIIPIYIYVWEEGLRMCERQGLEGPLLHYRVSNLWPWRNFGFVFNYLARIFEGIKIGLFQRVENPQNTILYSASEFWMDSFPATLLKLRYPTLKWVAAWYQTAPSPIQGFTEGKRERVYRKGAILYWLVQQPVKQVISKFADFIFVNNQKEQEQFPKHYKKNKTVVVTGAVDLDRIYCWRKRNKNIPKRYDAVFQGRFHPQKGVLELIDIWKKVVRKKPGAKLAMIGDGPLMKEVKEKIKKEGLENNIKLYGWMFDGPDKYKLFASSKLVVHPAFYDSGGMASAEAMAFGLPCVGFDLPAYKSYYPKGMLRVKIGDLNEFEDAINELLTNGKLYKLISNEAMQMIKDNWSWDRRAKDVFGFLRK
ncbi:MAG: glycosyltransferase [Patescibacteria group bacterium]|nr:glycosyltransferase [Patescibacteria group bacterium]